MSNIIEIKKKTKQFIEETFLFEFDDEITEESDLFKAGVIDSFGYVQLIKYLESEFKIKFLEEEVLSNVLVTFQSIIDFVSEKNKDLITL